MVRFVLRLPSLAELCCITALSCAPTLACQPSAPHEAGAPSDGGPSVPVDPVDPASLPAFCRRERDDPIRDAFCQKAPPDIRSLRDLQSLLKLALSSESDRGITALAPLVILGHSTALSAEHVSPLNPRVILIGGNTALAFNRGVQQVEIATRDYASPDFNFFLITFEQACNSAPGGCTPGDLYSPRIESDWTRVLVEDDEDLKNTPSDCRQCHQRGRDSSVLLMRELDGPWTHFFQPEEGYRSEEAEPGLDGVDLMHAYLEAKGDETYAGVPTAFLRTTAGFTLELVVQRAQPLFFDVTAIHSERFPWTPETGYGSAPVPSATWYRGYEAFKRGEQLALPHFDAMPTDPEKQARLSAAYRSYRAGEIGAEQLPDLADIFPDDPQVRAEIGLQTEPSATPAQALVQACGTCHNDVLDQSISRARFNIDLARMSRSELDEAIARLKLPADAPFAMPPLGRRRLDPEGRARLIEYLEKNLRSSDDDALLGRAAQLGMLAGGN